MEEVFIEQLDQVYWKGYGEALKENSPNAYYEQLSVFKDNHKISKKQYQTLCLVRRLIVQADYQNVSHTVNEVIMVATFLLLIHQL